MSGLVLAQYGDDYYSTSEYDDLWAILFWVGYLGFVVLGLVFGLRDIRRFPDWAWDRTPHNRSTWTWLWVIAVVLFPCGSILSLVMFVIYFTSVRKNLKRVMTQGHLADISGQAAAPRASAPIQQQEPTQHGYPPLPETRSGAASPVPPAPPGYSPPAGDIASVGPPSGGKDPLLDQLAQLADLRDRGVLSNEEFESQKRRLLGEQP